MSHLSFIRFHFLTSPFPNIKDVVKKYGDDSMDIASYHYLTQYINFTLSLCHMFLRILSALGYVLARCFSIKSYIAFVMLTCGYHAALGQTTNKKHVAGISNGYLKAKFDANLSNKVRETSGLIWWNNQVW